MPKQRIPSSGVISTTLRRLCVKEIILRTPKCLHALEKELSDAVELIDMGEAEGDIEVVEEAEAVLSTQVGCKAGT